MLKVSEDEAPVASGGEGEDGDDSDRQEAVDSGEDDEDGARDKDGEGGEDDEDDELEDALPTFGGAGARSGSSSSPRTAPPSAAPKAKAKRPLPASDSGQSVPASPSEGGSLRFGEFRGYGFLFCEPIVTFLFDCSGESEFVASASVASESEETDAEEEAPKKKKAKTAARTLDVQPRNRSSKPQVVHLRLMGRQRVAWRMHLLRREILRLANVLKRTRVESERWASRYWDANMALHELSNGAGAPATQLYRAGELVDRIPYRTRDHIGELVWRASAAMKASQRDASSH